MLFHSVLGNRPGMKQAAALLREAGHTVHLIDQCDGIFFDDYTPAIAGPVVTGGFSNGAGMAQ